MNTSLHVSDLLCTYMTCELKATYAYEYRFACKATYCVRIRLVRSKRLIHTSTAFFVKVLILKRLSWLVDVEMTVVRMLDDSSDVVVTVVIVWPYLLVAPEDLSKRYDLLVSFLRRSCFPIGPSLSFGLQGSAAIFFWRTLWWSVRFLHWTISLVMSNT